MDIDLDDRPPPQAHGPSWLMLGLAVVLTAVLATITTRYSADHALAAAATAPRPEAHMITLWANGGQATYAAVWTLADGRIWPVASQSSQSYQDPRAAVLTVMSTPNSRAQCRITVDGQAVSIEDAGPAPTAQTATCMWLAPA